MLTSGSSSSSGWVGARWVKAGSGVVPGGGPKLARRDQVRSNGSPSTRRIGLSHVILLCSDRDGLTVVSTVEVGHHGGLSLGGGLMKGLRTRFWIETGLGAVSLLFLVLTLAWHDWIEIVFGVDPDHHNGSAEWLTVAVSALVMIVFAVLARIEFRRSRQALA